MNVPEDIFQPMTPRWSNLVTVVSLDVTKDEPALSSTSGVLTTGGDRVYANLDNLYVFDRSGSAEDGSTTQILQFVWDNDTGSIHFVATGEVPGAMLNQFSADEHDGYLRIATTSSNFRSGNWSGRSENDLFVLQEDGGILEFVGSLQNLAMGESIRSVRYMGERGFVVTFRNIDPLFGLDLSDPADPRAVGQLKVPGFSSYMQLIDETHLLAVGRNTPDGRSGPPQVSLFDVSDLTRPVLIDNYTFERFSTTEAALDHHAFGWFAQHQVLAIPSGRAYWKRVDEDGDGFRETRKRVREDELLIFTIDITPTERSDAGIQLLGHVEHDSQVRRSAYIENTL